jgi:hypothetical protein
MMISDEILQVIKNMPNNNAPGLDGFNGLFIKKCWNIIKQDFERLVQDFCSNNVDLKCINTSMIALIPEKQNPKTVDDYRPISLLNYSLKVLTKLIANRLQPVMNQLIHENQCGFIKERSIQDCLGWAFQFLHICHHSKKEIVILKLDFQKAFEKIEHRFILQILEHKGFGPKWTSWIRNLLQSGSSSVLLNGILGKPFTYKRGVKQGDPLSPLLFVLAADFLQSIVNKAWHMSILKHPICEDFGSNFPIVQYADDTLLILLASASILFTLERSLFGFGN